MLTSYPNLDSTFCNPVTRSSTPSTASSGDTTQDLCFQLPAERQRDHLWLGGLKDLYWWTEGCPQRDCAKDQAITPAPKTSGAMEERIEPEDDLKRLIQNELKLRLSGYYYGNLSWVDASHILKRSKVGTFLVRDSEHCSYLYALSVQTKRGPTSCRIEYYNGRFRLDSSDELAEKMPRFESVTDLIDHYVHLTKNLPRKNNTAKELAPVWLDMDEENSMDVPVQIYKPLYKNVRSLQHLCRVTMVKMQKEKYPNMPISRTINEQEYKILPTVLKDYLKEYPYSQ